jgi:hypothetical protein
VIGAAPISADRPRGANATAAFAPRRRSLVSAGERAVGVVPVDERADRPGEVGADPVIDRPVTVVTSDLKMGVSGKIRGLDMLALPDHLRLPSTPQDKPTP